MQLNGNKLIYIYICIKIVNDTDSMCIDTDNVRYSSVVRLDIEKF